MSEQYPYPERVTTHPPIVVTDGGPWADHDMACAVCRERPAVLFLNTGTFEPCWSCQEAGWALVKMRPRVARWWRRWQQRLRHRGTFTVVKSNRRC